MAPANTAGNSKDTSRYQPYDYVAVLRGDKEAKVLAEGRTMAKSEDHARLIVAASHLPDDVKDRLDEVEIRLRPF